MTDPADPHYFARRAAESDAKRRRIIAEVARAAGPNDDIDYLTKRELYSAGLISSSELHATGSPELLPRGWYQHYVEAIDEYCPTRVFSLAEAGPDAADLYDRRYRSMVVFSERTGPSGDHTFIDVRSFAAAAMTEQNSLAEQAALSQILHMGYRITDLPNDIFMTPPATIPQQSTPAPRSHLPLPPPVVGRATLDPHASATPRGASGTPTRRCESVPSTLRHSG